MVKPTRRNPKLDTSQTNLNGWFSKSPKTVKDSDPKVTVEKIVRNLCLKRAESKPNSNTYKLDKTSLASTNRTIANESSSPAEESEMSKVLSQDKRCVQKKKQKSEENTVNLKSNKNKWTCKYQDLNKNSNSEKKGISEESQLIKDLKDKYSGSKKSVHKKCDNKSKNSQSDRTSANQTIANGTLSHAEESKVSKVLSQDMRSVQKKKQKSKENSVNLKSNKNKWICKYEDLNKNSNSGKKGISDESQLIKDLKVKYSGSKKSVHEKCGKPKNSQSATNNEISKSKTDLGKTNLIKPVARSTNRHNESMTKKSAKSLNITVKKINVQEKNQKENLESDIGKDNSRFTKKNTTSTKKQVNAPSVKTLKRFNSSSSDDLPTFTRNTSRKRLKQTDTFKKYGVIVPSFEEIIADQKHLSSYKTQVEEVKTLREPPVNIPTTPPKTPQLDEHQLLDCKHLTLADIKHHFNKNVTLLWDIMNEKKPSDRHKRYNDKNAVRDSLTTKDLTYSTSTIVFTFEQLDYIVQLMREQFDPEDNKTCYFFKVLVPELCFIIFMETHNMNRRKANSYLDQRPVK